MSRQYSREKLLWLRQSPLVSKPAGLPPVEEWMGPIPETDPRQKEIRNRTISRGKNEESNTGETTTARRPGFEPRVKSGMNPDDIVLGPPRTSFASAGRKSGQALESSQRQGSSNQDDEAQKDRSTYKDRFSRDGIRIEKNGEPGRETRPGARPRNEKTDSDVWSNVRGQRTSGHEDQDRSFRRNGDRDFDRDRRDERRYGDRGGDGSRNTNGEGSERRGWEPRSRNQPSWSRDENSKDGLGNDRESTKPRGWREKEPQTEMRGHDRYWDKAGKQETNPEWMDEPEGEGKKQAYTADDFEQWKAKMKAGNGAGKDPPSESKRKPSINDDDTFGDTASPPAKPTTGKESKPLLLDSDFDDFFGMGTQKPASKDQQENGAKRNISSSSGKGSKASKFSSLFTPAAETPPVLEQAPPPMPAPANDSSDADKEGFARILTLLGGQQQAQVELGTPPRSKSQQKQSISSPPHSPTGGMYEKGSFPSTMPQQAPPHVNQMPANLDQQFLLGLMQQQQQQQQQQQPRPEAQAGSRRYFDGPPNIPFSNMMISPSDHVRQPSQSTGPSPGYMADAFREDMPRDKLNPTTGGEQRRPPPGLADMFTMQRPGQPFIQPGMRPPGYDMAPQPQPQFQRPKQNMGPPPGIPPGLQRGQNAFPPGLLPGMPDRQQFSMRPNGPGMPGGPPGPPPFMAMNGPPPGLSNMPFVQDGGMPFGGGFGDFGPGGGGPPPGFPGQGRR